MKNGILLILILQLGLVNLGKACDCDYGYIYHNSVEVFIGYAERIELEEGGAWKKATLVVKEIYKAESQKIDANVSIFSLPDICGYAWEVGYYYLVFVEEIKEGRHFVNMCSMTRPIHYRYDLNGTWIGVPTLEEVKGWDFENAIMKKWKGVY